MSYDISKMVKIIEKHMCKDCEQRCGLCEHGVCQDVIIEIGCYFLHCAEMQEKEEQE